MHFPSVRLVAIAGLAAQTSASPHPRRDQMRSRAAPRSVTYHANSTRTDAVKQTFQIAWDGYYQYAFPHDSLQPQTNDWSDDR